MQQLTHEYLTDNNLILFECIVGSQAYGTQIPTSDVDKKFVYILPLDNILGSKYVEQINIDKDYTGWEIKRFLELLTSNNPTVVELLNTPQDCIISKHPLFDIILENKDKFITKMCKNSFGGYARQQIVKAKGLNKKQNWENDKVIRKDVLDFCYVIQNGKTLPWKKWNNEQYDEKYIGATKLNNAKNVYCLYYDETSDIINSQKNDKFFVNVYKYTLKMKGEPMGLGYKGLINDDENSTESNQLKLSSIPKGENILCTIVYDKDAYSSHCKDFKAYQEWLENRNENRYVETKEHGQKIDGKNMMHCIRLIRMAQEIGRDEGINVRRNDAQELLSIRRGEKDLQELINLADEMIIQMDEIFDKSNLPKCVDSNFVNELLIRIRKEFYKLNKKNNDTLE